MNLDFLGDMQRKFIKNYTSLITRVGIEEMSTVLRFCTLFQSHNIELYKKFKDSKKTYKDIIDIYGEMCGINPQENMESIMNQFYQNAIGEGVSYHLNSSANLENILNLGLGTSLIGLKTEERQDKERLKELVSPKVLGKLQPFYSGESNENVGKVFFSTIPMLGASYGDRPEWLKMLKSNYNIFKDVPEYPISEEAREFISATLQKYDEKYSGQKRMLFILPYIGENVFSDNDSPEESIKKFYENELADKNVGKSIHIPGSEIISIDLENGDLYISDGKDGVIKINPQEQVKQYEEQPISLSSEYDMREVSIGNTGQMYEIKDKENGREYYFKPAISKRGEKRPYRAHIQEAAYRIQRIINPDRAVQCNTIEIEGIFGAIQEKVPIDFEATRAFKEYFNEGNGYLSDEILSQILDEYLVDFCLCNYDAHERNFVIDQNRNLRGIDKEQSFRYINEDKDRDPMFSTNYNARYGENPPIYNLIFENMAYGVISNDFLTRLAQKAKMLSKIPDDEYRNIFKQYAYVKCDTAENAEELLDNILDRKRNIQKSVEQLINAIHQEIDYQHLREYGLTKAEYDEFSKERQETTDSKSFDAVVKKYEEIKARHKAKISPTSAIKNALVQGATTEQVTQARSIESAEQSIGHFQEETKDDK